MIRIEQLIPLLKDGWVAMDRCGDWYFYKHKPSVNTYGEWKGDGCEQLGGFYIESVEEWTESLIEIKDGKRV